MSIANDNEQGGARALPQLDAEWLAEVRERAPGFVADFADRIGEGDEVLARAACPKGCFRCVRECACRQIQAEWWGREHAEAEALAGRALSHNGVIYAQAAGRA